MGQTPVEVDEEAGDVTRDGRAGRGMPGRFLGTADWRC